tara:strand:- start:285 stop:1247 length:963 start_codon:yes stop_codon:yes gene_type:complete
MIKAPKFWYKENISIFSIVLLPLNILWIFGGLVKKLISKKRKVSIPVISIGSAIIGGSGKTPTVLFICDLLKKIGLDAHIVSKGYGGYYSLAKKVTKELTYQEVGDEALMMSSYHTTWVAKNKYQGCRMAEKDGADVVVLDDGLQNSSILKNFSIYVFDGIQKFGNKFLVPAGPLRENVKKALSKCSIVFQINEDEVMNEFKDKFQCFAKYKLEEKHHLLDKNIIAFAGLGFNKKFFDQLKSYGFKVIKTVDFPDHHKYSVEDIYSLLDIANTIDAHLLTTEKDHIRIPKDFKKSINFIKGRIELESEDDLIQQLKKNIA